MTNEIVLVDTTVWIHFLRGSGTSIEEKLVPLIISDRLATSPVIIMEILRGAKTKKDYDKLHEDLSALRCFDTSGEIWERAFELAYMLRKNGLNVPLTDTLIAALAIENKALLLHDDRHYEMIASVVKLRHERISPTTSPSSPPPSI
jgi:predicted nucleic acid-binding protein